MLGLLSQDRICPSQDDKGDAMARLEAAIFDFDNTLVSTGVLKAFRDAAQFGAITDDLVAKTKVYRPVVNLIRKLRENDVKIGIVTNSPRKYVTRLLDHHQLSGLFDQLVAYDDVGAEGKKPSPAGLDLAIKNLKVRDRSRVAYIGDEYIDVVAAYRAEIIPIVATWGSKESVSTPPGALLHSMGLLQMASDIDEKMLFAERCADRKSTNFSREEARFLNLDENADVATVRHKMKTFCLGRYFSQTGATTAALHDKHELSLEIAKKDLPGGYTPPQWMAEMLLKVVRAAGSYIHEDKRSVDIVTVVPRKSGKPERLELVLRKMEELSKGAGGSIQFRDDILYFDERAVKSLRGLKPKERRIEQEANLRCRAKDLAGKSVVIIDDVITTGATINKAIRLVEALGAADVHGLGIAKTVSIQEDLKKECSVCGRNMLISKNRSTGERFWSCSGYHDAKACSHTEPLTDNPCPWCGRQLRLKQNQAKKTLFYGCPGWSEKPPCKYTRSK